MPVSSVDAGATPDAPSSEASGLESQARDVAAGVLAKAARENFPVAPRMLPTVLRRDLMAIYGFARFVDDLGDEATGTPADRERLLDLVDADIDRLFSGAAPRLPLLDALVAPIAQHGLPAEPFRRLVQANRQDQRVARYATIDELVAYCTLSADPVGHLVLGIFDAVTPERVAWSNDICTALQLVEHWQDVAEDHARGRIYLPLDDLAAYGVTEPDLVAGPTPDAVRRLVAFECRRAAALFDRGAPLVASLDGLARICVDAFLAGGRATLAAIEASDFDVLAATRRPRKGRLVRELVTALRAGGR